MPQRSESKQVADAARSLQVVFARMFPEATAELYPIVLRDVAAMFMGRFADYQRIDTPYHNLNHTLQVLECFAEILEARHEADIEPKLTARYFELGVVGVLLHDTGYLKASADYDGTGAKYTPIHVARSCEVAKSYLPAHHVTGAELDSIINAIRCTTFGRFDRALLFKEPIEGIIGCALATADYLSQMAAANYVEQLPLLFAEISEADAYSNIPPEQRRFQSAAELIAATPNFWHNTVLPRLEKELLGLYRFLSCPYPDGPNRYLEAIQANLVRIGVPSQ